MSKKLLKFFCFNFLLVFIACAPKAAPPSVYLGKELSLDEIMQKVGGDIGALKAIADINIEKNNESYDYVNASIILKTPGWVHMRIYKFGMLAKDFVIKDQNLFVLAGKSDNNLKTLGNELYNAIFWWDEFRYGMMSSSGNEYVIRADDREIHIDKSTLMPLKQSIPAFNQQIEIVYNGPVKEEDGYWHPSLINIYAGDFGFEVKIRKLLKNPAPGENDFKTADQNN